MVAVALAAIGWRTQHFAIILVKVSRFQSLEISKPNRDLGLKNAAWALMPVFCKFLKQNHIPLLFL
jgi:hypothetical protein